MSSHVYLEVTPEVAVALAAVLKDEGTAAMLIANAKIIKTSLNLNAYMYQALGDGLRVRISRTTEENQA